MKRRTLFLIQLILLVGLLATLVTQDGISVHAQQIRPQITNHTDGQWIKDKKGWWYKYPDGSFPRNQWQQINGRYYFFNVNGYMLTGWQELDGFGYYKEKSWYYFDPENGDMKTGWQNIKGKWYYLDPAEGYMLTGVQQVGENGECYYFHNKNGDMQTGWQQLTGAGNHEGPAWYYFNPADGSMLTGWQNIQEKWYYFQPIDGYMLTGLHQIGDAGKSYYLNPVNGEMLTGWQQIADEWYYFATEDGSMLSNAWQGSYYLKEDGKIAHSETLLINGKQYTFNEQGLVTTNP